MEIFDIMDCAGCESSRHIPGRAWGDPDSCYPPEDTCLKDAPDNGPCDRMLGAIHDCIMDGQLETAKGYFSYRECLQEQQQDEIENEWFREYDFSSAPYWWLPNVYDPADENTKPVPYKDDVEVYKEWFT